MAATVATANGGYVFGNFFETFGISPCGRLLADADEPGKARRQLRLSSHTWQIQYGSDSCVVGGAYDLNGHPFMIAGIAPSGFFGAKIADSGIPDFWLPLTTEPLIAGATSRLRNPRLAWLDLIGRVRPDTNPKTLEAQLQVELHQWLATHAPDMTSQEKIFWRKTLRLTPGGAGVSLMRESYKEALWLLLMASICVLLVACANIANLLLARGLRDRHQTALRVALGASRAQLVRKALVESLTLSVFGAAVGTVDAYAGARLILHLAITGADTRVPVNPTPSVPVLLFALGISVVIGVAFGIVPAWIASLADPTTANPRHWPRFAGSRQGRRSMHFTCTVAQRWDPHASLGARRSLSISGGINAPRRLRAWFLSEGALSHQLRVLIRM